MSSKINANIREEIERQINLKTCHCGSHEFQFSELYEKLIQIMDIARHSIPEQHKCSKCGLTYEFNEQTPDE